MRSSPAYTKGSVTSADGTTIGYRQLGTGPAVILLHGGVNAAQHMMGLGQDLAALVPADGRGVCLRPGRRRSVALYGAIRLEHVTKVAAYEPLLFAGQEGIEDYQRVFSAMQAKLRAGHNGDALIYSTQETATLATRRGQFSAWAASMLRSIPTHDDHVAWQDLLPALAPALDLVKLSEGTLDDYRHLAADVLLMYGSESDTVFADTADALHGVLPRSTVIQLRDATTTPRRPTANPTVSPTSCGCSSRSDAPGKGDALPGFDEPAVVLCTKRPG